MDYQEFQPVWRGDATGPQGAGWYVLHRKGKGLASTQEIVGGPYETEGEADDYARHLRANPGEVQ